MGIFDALNTSVGGLQAQSFALQNISGNIANASTIGYKGIDTSFEDLIPDATTPTGRSPAASPPSRKRRSPPRAPSRHRRSQPTWRSTATASSRCRRPPASVDNAPVFSGVTDYTRRGDFQVNANGNLVNGAGYYLMGVSVDPKTGNPIGNVPQVLQFQNNFVPAQADQRDSICREPSDHARDHGKHHRERRHADGRRRPQPV